MRVLEIDVIDTFEGFHKRLFMFNPGSKISEVLAVIILHTSIF